MPNAGRSSHEQLYHGIRASPPRRLRRAEEDTNHKEEETKIKKAVAILILLSCLALCCACEPKTATQAEIAEQEQKPGTFAVLEDGVNYDIVYDKKTRVMYCLSRGGYNNGNLYPLYNADGTLRLYEN